MLDISLYTSTVVPACDRGRGLGSVRAHLSVGGQVDAGTVIIT